MVFKLSDPEMQCPNCFKAHKDSHSIHICPKCGSVFTVTGPKVGTDGHPAPQPCPGVDCGEQRVEAVSYVCAVCRWVEPFQGRALQ